MDVKHHFPGFFMQCWFNLGSASRTLNQHCYKVCVAPPPSWLISRLTCCILSTEVGSTPPGLYLSTQYSPGACIDLADTDLWSPCHLHWAQPGVWRTRLQHGNIYLWTSCDYQDVTQVSTDSRRDSLIDCLVNSWRVWLRWLRRRYCDCDVVTAQYLRHTFCIT